MRYRRISPLVWADAKFLQLSAPKPNAQTLWLYLLTSEHRTIIPGVIRNVGPATLAECLGWSTKSLLKCWSEIESAGMAQADWAARLIWMPKSMRYEPAENPNQIKGWRAAWDELPQCQLTNVVLEAIVGYLKPLPDEWRKAFGTVPLTVLPTVPKQGTGTGTGAGAGTVPPQPFGQPLVNQAAHRRHACCGQVCLPDFLFAQFVRLRGGDEQTARTYVNGWWSRLDDELQRDGRPTIGDEVAFLKSRWALDHPTPKPTERPRPALPKGDAIFAGERL